MAEQTVRKSLLSITLMFTINNSPEEIGFAVKFSISREAFICE